MTTLEEFIAKLTPEEKQKMLADLLESERLLRDIERRYPWVKQSSTTHVGQKPGRGAKDDRA